MADDRNRSQDQQQQNATRNVWLQRGWNFARGGWVGPWIARQATDYLETSPTGNELLNLFVKHEVATRGLMGTVIAWLREWSDHPTLTTLTDMIADLGEELVEVLSRLAAEGHSGAGQVLQAAGQRLETFLQRSLELDEEKMELLLNWLCFDLSFQNQQLAIRHIMSLQDEEFVKFAGLSDEQKMILISVSGQHELQACRQQQPPQQRQMSPALQQARARFCSTYELGGE